MESKEMEDSGQRVLQQTLERSRMEQSEIFQQTLERSRMEAEQSLVFQQMLAQSRREAEQSDESDLERAIALSKGHNHK